MNQTDERHLFDLIVNPILGALTVIAVPIAVISCCVSIFSGRFFYLIPLALLLVLGVADIALFIIRLIAANRKKSSQVSYHGLAFLLLVITLLLSIGVILSMIL